MKRQSFYFLTIAAALALGFASCSNDEIQAPGQDGRETTVQFTAQLPAGIASRAFGDGYTATDLTYAVYETGVTPKKAIIEGHRNFTTGSLSTTVSLKLVNGKTYDILFWADDPEAPYTFDASTQTVTINYDNVASNAENRDAFFAAYKDFKVTGPINKEILLYRPFAQVNFGSDDLEEVAVEDAYPQLQTKLVTKAYSKLNLLTGEASEQVDVTYGLAAVPEDETFPVTGYDYLSMNYLLAGEAQEIVDMTFSLCNGATEISSLTVNSVPVQRNYRTNIYGSLLTSTADFKVTKDPIFDEPDYNYSQLLLAAQNGGVVTLDEDISLKSRLIVEDGKTMTLNLNGHSIVPPTNEDRTIQVNEGAILVINGEGTIGALDSEALAIAVNGGTLVINGGTFYGGNDSSCLYMFKGADGMIEINDGYFAVGSPNETHHPGWYYVLNLQNGATGTISVKGGKFENYNPADGDDNDQPTNFVAEGYSSVKVSEDPDVYQVVQGVGASTSQEILDAINNDEPIITLTQDIAITNTLTINKDITLIGNGSTTITGEPIYLQGENSTIKGINFNNGTTGTQSAIYITNGNSKNLVIEDCLFSNAKWDAIQLTKASESIVIRNCHFKNTELGYRYIHLEIRNASNGYGTTNAKLEISGCTFENVSEKYCKDSAVTIAGFLFDNMNISNNIVKGEGDVNSVSFWICNGTTFSELYTNEQLADKFIKN